jgi:hypothetical protein
MDINKAIFTRLRRYIPVELCDHLGEAILKEDYGAAFLLIGSHNYMDAYESIFPLMPDSKKYELFITAYAGHNYAQSQPKKINNTMITRIYELKPKKLVKRLNKKADNEGYITIYRGENSKSTKTQKALSWTLYRLFIYGKS